MIVRKCFNKLNPSFVNDNKQFWKTVKPLFSNKGSSGSNIKLVGEDEVLQCDGKIAEEFNTFLKNAVFSLEINENSSIINQNIQNVDDPVDGLIEMYKYHPSNIFINKKVDNQNKFSFEPVEVSDVVKEIKETNPNKSSTQRQYSSKNA